MKPKQRAPAPRAPDLEESKPTSPIERHSGEGSASALEMLQRLEKRKVAARAHEPREDSAR